MCNKSKAIKWLKSQITDDTTKAEIDTISFIRKCVEQFADKNKKVTQNADFDAYIMELYIKFYKCYCRRGAKQQGLKTFRKKLISLKTKEEILDKARKIAKLYILQKNELEGRDERYRPLISSWLNSNIPD